MNLLMMQGRVPFEPKFYEATGDKKAFASFTLAINTGIKDEETGYHKEDLFRCLVSGGWAENLAKNWNNKMVITISGKLVMGKDYEKDGEIVSGQPEIRVFAIHDYNTLDTTVLRAKIPNFENAIMYKAAEGEKKAFIRLKLSISTGIKDEETGYYKERIITAKAFGATADFINNYYKSGDFITLDGKYVDGQDYEKDGEIIKAMPELIINNVYGFPRRKDEENSNTSSTIKPSINKPKLNVVAKTKPSLKVPGKSKLGAPKLGLKK